MYMHNIYLHIRVHVCVKLFIHLYLYAYSHMYVCTFDRYQQHHTFVLASPCLAELKHQTDALFLLSPRHPWKDTGELYTPGLVVLE